ncbi:MAG: pyridoxamine 5'-phosphate oxidase family protein [Ardenticatenaceae bacterium]|nr:pyridoxamine 5'-phosphate oxidase family protein [Ardenticatenaceae bacterium]
MDEQRDYLERLLKTFRVAALITVSADGAPSARPMLTLGDVSTREIWFMTRLDTEKGRNIQSNPNVGIYFATDGDQRYVSLRGRAEIIRDRELIRTRWTEQLQRWFRQGPDTPNLALVKVVPHEAEYWDERTNREERVTLAS